MLDTTIDLSALRRGGQALRRDPDAFAGTFYDILFAMRPDMRPLFPADMSDQGRKLVATLAVMIDGIAEPARLAPILAALARRHVGYGVRPEHYATVLSALLETLHRVDTDPDALAAWQAALERATGAMIAAAYPLAPAPPPRRPIGREAPG